MIQNTKTITGDALVSVLKAIGFEEVGGAYLCYEDGSIELLEIIIGDGDITISYIYDYPNSGWEYQNQLKEISWTLYHLIMACETMDVEWMIKTLTEYCNAHNLEYPVK